MMTHYSKRKLLLRIFLNFSNFLVNSFKTFTSSRDKSDAKNNIFSINQSIIYLFSKEKTIINKYNAIKLNKTNKTLRNNLAYYLLWEKGLQKAKKPYQQALCVQGGRSRHPRQRTL